MPSPTTTERSVADVLRAAKERIVDPASWCRGAFAKDAQLRHVDPTDPSACRFCALGAIAAETRVAGPMTNPVAERLAAAAGGVGTAEVVGLNDGKDGLSRSASHRQMLELFDCAIELAEAEA